MDLRDDPTHSKVRGGGHVLYCCYCRKRWLHQGIVILLNVRSNVILVSLCLLTSYSPVEENRGVGLADQFIMASVG